MARYGAPKPVATRLGRGGRRKEPCGALFAQLSERQLDGECSTVTQLRPLPVTHRERFAALLGLSS